MSNKQYYQARLASWEDHLQAAYNMADSVETDYPFADASLKARIATNCADSVKTCEEFVKYYEDLLED